MDLVPIWYKDRYCTPLPPPTPHARTHTHTHTYPGHVKIKVTDLEFSRNKICNIRRAILSSDRSCYICLFCSDFTSLSVIFQPYPDGVWMQQGAQCSLLECCLTKISCLRDNLIFHAITLYWHQADQFWFLGLLAKEQLVPQLATSQSQRGHSTNREYVPVPSYNTCILFQSK